MAAYWTLVRRELSSHFLSWTGYVIVAAVVFLIGVAPRGAALLDHQLYLPESWCQDDEAGRDRRAKAHIPETITFQTKPEIAGAMVRRTAVVDQVPLDWITADETYGRNGDFLDEL